MIHQHAGSITDGLFRVDRAVGFQINNQLVQIGTLLHPSRFNLIADAAHRAERSIHQDTADGLVLFLVRRAGIGGNVAATSFDLDLHFQLAAGSNVGNHVVGIDDFDIVRHFDIGRRDNAFAFFGQGQRRFAATVQLEHDALEIEQNIDHVFAHAVQRGVLVQHAAN